MVYKPYFINYEMSYGRNKLKFLQWDSRSPDILYINTIICITKIYISQFRKYLRHIEKRRFQTLSANFWVHKFSILLLFWAQHMNGIRCSANLLPNIHFLQRYKAKNCENRCILKHEITVEQLYEELYHGTESTLNILDSSDCLRKSKLFQQLNPENFTRTVRF